MRSIFFILFCFLCCFYSIAQHKTDFLIRTIAFYNVENLFDYEKDPRIWDNEWTPDGKNNWTEEKYHDKLHKISRVISEIGADLTHTTPDIIGLAEIENIRVLEDLINQPSLRNSNYGIIHYNSPDRRGIDVAFLYKKKLFTPIFHQAFPLLLQNSQDSEKYFYSRDQLLVTGIFDGEEIHFIVNHWPSRFGGEKFSEPYRLKAAALTRKITDSILTKNETAKILIMGDFNDNPTDRSIKEILHSTGFKEKASLKKLYNPFEKMAKYGLGTLAYRDSWSLFDQILLSFELATTSNYSSYRFYKAEIFNRNHLQIRRGRYKGYPYRSFQNGLYTGGYSDHFPVFIYLIKAKQ